MDFDSTYSNVLINLLVCMSTLGLCSTETINVVVMEKSSITLPCDVGNNDVKKAIYWKVKYVNPELLAHSNTQVLLFNGQQLIDKERFAIKSSPGRCDFVIKQVRLTDAGIYECEIHWIQASIRRNITISLTVLAGPLECTLSWNNTKVLAANVTLSVNEVVEMECMLVHVGNSVPVMTWKSNNIHDGIAPAIVDVALNATTSKSINSLTINSSHNGAIFTCKTIFNQTQNLSNTIPDNQLVWLSPRMNVLYGPTNLTVSPSRAIYRPGEEIECRANSNPSPSFEWRDLDDGNITKGPIFVTSRKMIDQRVYRYQCTATSEMKTKNFKESSTVNISFQVQEADSSKPMNLIVILSVTITSVAVFGALLCVVLALRRRQAFLRSMHCTSRQPSEKDSESMSYNNKVKNDDGSTGSKRLPMAIYAEARNVDDCFAGSRKAECSNSDRGRYSPQIPLPVMYTGNDGTVYMELNPQKIGQCRGPHVPPISRMVVHDSSKLYAMIDHTRKPPPYPGASMPRRKFVKLPEYSVDYNMK